MRRTGGSSSISQTVSVFSRFYDRHVLTSHSSALDWIDATTPFVRNGDAWDQPVLAASLLQQIKRVNQRQLANINITGSYKIGQKTVEKITLDKLVDMGQGRDRNVAPAVLEAFFTELYSSETS